jgi:uncharacterized protein (TIGR04255 family)
VNDAGSELIQFQPDRFIHNWRKGKRDHKYPRYENIRDRFRGELDTLAAWIRKAGRSPQLTLSQCEITYVNHIRISEDPGTAYDAGLAVTALAPAKDLPFPADFEDVRFSLRYRLTKDGEPYGRLHVRADPIVGRDGEAIVGLVLTARGRPDPATVDGAFAFFNEGRDRIVTSFTQLTHGKMHKLWGRTK